jgi:hypothetical protein
MRPASLRNWLLALACCVFALSGLLAQEPPGRELTSEQIDRGLRNFAEKMEEEQRARDPYRGFGEGVPSHSWLLVVFIILAIAIGGVLRRRE